MKKRPDGDGGSPSDHSDSGESEKSATSWETIQSGNHKVKRRRAISKILKTLKEREKTGGKDMNIAKFPSAPRYRRWRSALRNEIMNRAPNSDIGFQWFQEIPNKSFDELYDTSGHPKLDQELASALTRAQTGELGRRIAICLLYTSPSPRD